MLVVGLSFLPILTGNYTCISGLCSGTLRRHFARFRDMNEDKLERIVFAVTAVGYYSQFK